MSKWTRSIAPGYRERKPPARRLAVRGSPVVCHIGQVGLRVEGYRRARSLHVEAVGEDRRPDRGVVPGERLVGVTGRVELDLPGGEHLLRGLPRLPRRRTLVGPRPRERG